MFQKYLKKLNVFLRIYAENPNNGEHSVRIDQENGEYQEFKQWNLFPCDVVEGHIYGYDSSINSVVRMNCENLTIEAISPIAPSN
jgi:hypothetical protein